MFLAFNIKYQCNNSFVVDICVEILIMIYSTRMVENCHFPEDLPAHTFIMNNSAIEE